MYKSSSPTTGDDTKASAESSWTDTWGAKRLAEPSDCKTEAQLFGVVIHPRQVAEISQNEASGSKEATDFGPLPIPSSLLVTRTQWLEFHSLKDLFQYQSRKSMLVSFSASSWYVLVQCCWVRHCWSGNSGCDFHRSFGIVHVHWLAWTSPTWGEWSWLDLAPLALAMFACQCRLLLLDGNDRQWMIAVVGCCWCFLKEVNFQANWSLVLYDLPVR